MNFIDELFNNHKEINTIILSDIHLGSDVCRAESVIETLKKYRFKKLILLGDIFDSLNFKRLKKKHWDLLSFVRKLSNPKNNIEVIWVEGNHDEGLSMITSHFLGIRIYKEYKWTIKGKKYLAIHGHQFDRFLNENVVISAIASFFYDLIQKIGRENQTIARWIKGKSKGWLRLSTKIANSAVEYGRKKNADYVICGHTHQALYLNFEEKGIKYYNTGCWTDLPSSFIIIEHNGNVSIEHVYKTPKKAEKEKQYIYEVLN